MKEPGHYKPVFKLVESRVPVGVKYEVEELKEQIFEKIQAHKRARDITCCNRVLRVIEKQA